jgi:hypothetical protein
MNWTNDLPPRQQPPSSATVPPRHSVVSVVRSYGILECETSGPLTPQAPQLRSTNNHRCENRSSEETFPYVAAWAGENADNAIRETQARVARAAKAIIAASPAEHDRGGKVLGADLAVSAARPLDQQAAALRAERQAQMADRAETSAALRYDGPEVA